MKRSRNETFGLLGFDSLKRRFTCDPSLISHQESVSTPTSIKPKESKRSAHVVRADDCSLRRPLPSYSSQGIMYDQSRLEERRRFDRAIAKIEAEKQIYLRELHHLQMAQTRGGPSFSTYVY